jgi:hypothetical protein
VVIVNFNAGALLTISVTSLKRKTFTGFRNTIPVATQRVQRVLCENCLATDLHAKGAVFDVRVLEWLEV